jgi:hypothetical protein
MPLARQAFAGAGTSQWTALRLCSLQLLRPARDGESLRPHLDLRLAVAPMPLIAPRFVADTERSWINFVRIS